LADGILLFLGAAFVLLLMLAEYCGGLAYSRLAQGGDLAKLDRDRIGHILTSTFGLLALLIGFSFSIALNRYDTRRADVVAEANAISTAHYRAGFVAPEYGAALQQSLEGYTAHRADFGFASAEQRPNGERDAARLRKAIGAAGQQLSPVVNSPLGASIVASVNEVLDLGVQREANLRARLPEAIFAVLVGLSLVGAGMMGLAYPPAGSLRRGSSLLLFTLMAVTITVILDLDRPARGNITIDQGPILQLFAEFSEENPVPGMPGNTQTGRTAR